MNRGAKLRASYDRPAQLSKITPFFLALRDPPAVIGPTRNREEGKMKIVGTHARG